MTTSRHVWLVWPCVGKAHVTACVLGGLHGVARGLPSYPNGSHLPQPASLAHVEGLQGTMFGGCIMLVCVQGTTHHTHTEARVVEPVMGRGRRVLALAVVMGQVLLVWSVFLPIACKGFHKLGTNG